MGPPPLVVAEGKRADKRRFGEVADCDESPSTFGGDGIPVPVPKRERIGQSPERHADYDDTLSDLSDLTELSDASDCSDVSGLEVLKVLGM